MTPTQFEREEKQLDDDLAAGFLTQAEHAQAYRELEQDYRADARDAAEHAYDDEIERWM